MAQYKRMNHEDFVWLWILDLNLPLAYSIHKCTEYENFFK